MDQVNPAIAIRNHPMPVRDPPSRGATVQPTFQLLQSGPSMWHLWLLAAGLYAFMFADIRRELRGE
jgi:hypothetical protein